MILFLNPAIFWSPVRQVLSYCSLYLELCPLRSFILWMMFFRLTPDKYISSGISLLSFLPSWSGTFWFSSFLMTVQFSLTMIYVSGLSCRKSDSYHCLILIMHIKLLKYWVNCTNLSNPPCKSIRDMLVYRCGKERWYRWPSEMQFLDGLDNLKVLQRLFLVWQWSE